MSIIVDGKIPRNLNNILLENLSSLSFKLVDMTADSFYLDRNLGFEDQVGSVVFELNIKPSIRGVVNDKIFSYNLVFQNVTTGEIISENVISFYDDFKNIIDTGETDYQAIVDEILKPQTIVMDSSLDPSGELSTGNPFSLYNAEEGSFLSFAESSSLMIGSGVDPDDAAQMSMPKFPVSSTAFSLAGSGDETVSDFKLKKSKSYKVRNVGERLSLVSIRKDKESQIIPNVDTPAYRSHETTATGIIVDDTASEASESIDLGRRIQFISEYFDSKRIIELPKSLLEGGIIDAIFIPKFTLSNGSEEESDSTDFPFEAVPRKVRIHLSERLPSLLEPEVPPEIIIRSNTPGKISYSVKRNDPTTKNVLVTVRHVNQHTMQPAPAMEDKEINYIFEGYDRDIRHGVAEGCINKDPYVVQIIAQDIGPDGSGLASTSTVVKSFPSETLQDYKTNYVKVNAFLEVGGKVRVEIDQEAGTLASRIKICRENLSVPVGSLDRIKVLTDDVQPSAEFIHIDDTPIPNRTYRYYAVSEYSQSSASTLSATESVVSSCDSIIKVMKENKVLYKASVTKVGARSFKPTVSVVQSQAGLIESQLGSAGIDLSNFEDIENVRNDLRKLLYFVVERLDRSTGSREFMTIVQPNQNYTDINPSQLKRYTYIFRLAAADATASFVMDNVVKSKEAIDSKTLNEYVNLLNQSLTSASGVIESADSFFQKTDEYSTIKAGMTSVEVAYTVSPNFKITAPKMLKPITKLEGFRGEGPSIKLRWSVDDSELKHIDCFYVYCRYQGEATVIQTLNCSNSVTKYCYVDTKYFNEVGRKVYYVVSRYKDYVFGPVSKSVVRTKYVPISLKEIKSSQIILPVTKKTFIKKVPFNNVVTSFGSPKDFFEG